MKAVNEKVAPQEVHCRGGKDRLGIKLPVLRMKLFSILKKPSVSLKQHIRYNEHTTTCLVCRKEFANTDSALDHVCKKHNICVS